MLYDPSEDQSNSIHIFSEGFTFQRRDEVVHAASH